MPRPLNVWILALLVCFTLANATHAVEGGGSDPLWVDVDASATFVAAGEPTILVISISGANYFTVTPDGTSYDPDYYFVGVSPTETTQYVVEAFSDTESVTDSITIDVAPVRIVSFTTDPAVLDGPGATRLSWEVRATGSVYIDGFGFQPLTGSLIVPVNESGNFTLRAANGAFETQAQAQLLLLSEPGGSMVLSWSEDSIPGEPMGADALKPHFFVHVFGVSEMSGYEMAVRLASCSFSMGYTLHPSGTTYPSADYQPFNISFGECLPGPRMVVEGRSRVQEEYCTLENHFVTLEAAEFSSFDPPAPGYIDCAGERHPLNLGPPLYYPSNFPVPVVSYSLDAQPHTRGVQLTWATPAGVSPTSITVQRGTSATDLQRIVTLPGVRGPGAWVDEYPMGSNASYQLVAQVDGIEWSSEVVQYTPNVTVPNRSMLLANRPNPFNPTTQLRFALSEPGDVRLRIIGLSGRVVRTFDLDLPSGQHSVPWNGQDERGHSVASGTYVVEFEAGRARDSGRITLLK